MDSFKQLLCILFSFFYGITISFIFSFINKFSQKMNLIFRLLLFIISVILLSILYIYVIYKINGGIVNVYFYFLIAFGFILFNVKKRQI